MDASGKGLRPGTAPCHVLDVCFMLGLTSRSIFRSGEPIRIGNDIDGVMLLLRIYTLHNFATSFAMVAEGRRLPALLMRKVASVCLRCQQYHKVGKWLLQKDDYWC